MDKDPLKVDPVTAKDIRVLETIKKGKSACKAHETIIRSTKRSML